MDVAPERTWTYSQRVLKEGTARPRLPRKLTVCWSTGYLELSGIAVQHNRLICSEESASHGP